MPKDRSENIDRYKVRGGQFNDYQMDSDEIALTHPEGFERRQQEGDWPRASTPQGEPETEADRVRRLMEEARKKAQRKKAKAKGGKTAARKSVTKSSAKKSAKGATKTRSAKTAKARSAKKGTKRSVKKSASKRSGGKTASKKR